MKKLLVQFSILLFLLFSLFNNLIAQEIPYDLTKEDKKEILNRIDVIIENDQKFRCYMGTQTFDPTIQDHLDSLLTLGDPTKYFAYSNSLDMEFPREVNDAINTLQSYLDSINLVKLIEIVDSFGYPSKERLGIKHDRLFPVLLHPYNGLDVEEYQQYIFKKMLPEVKAKRMRPIMLARFYDNMNGKILRKPQLFGTNENIDKETFEILPPIITNLKETNIARKEIGLQPLEAGAYRLESNVK